MKDWTFLLGPSFMVGVGNGLILGYLMYRSGLMPRGLAMLGPIGGTLIILSGIGGLFDAWDAGSPVQGIATSPEFLWELSLGIYCACLGVQEIVPPPLGRAQTCQGALAAPHRSGRSGASLKREQIS